MSLVVVARFPALPQAHVAASLLQSAGIEAIVFDQYYGGLDWVAQSALGGYRLCAHFEDLADARAILIAPPQEPFEPVPASGGLVRAALALLATWLVGGEGGWVVAGLRRRVAPSLAEMALGTGIVIGATAALAAVVWGLDALLVHPP